MGKLSQEERWRLDEDDRYLMQLILEEVSRILKDGDSTNDVLDNDSIETSVAGVYAEAQDYVEVKYTSPSLLRGF